MPRRRPIKLEIIDNSEGRFIVRTFADGEQELEPVADLPRKKRVPARPYWQWKLKGRRLK